MDSELRLAILIDSDNISDKYIKIILDEASNIGVVTYKRIYGDWTNARMAPWKNVLLENSIMPIQQYSYTVGKNSTDSSMIIDAMDILYSDTVDGFCIVSSDSDFTRLAARLREAGMQVIGMGEEKTPKPFISACSQFKYLDLLYQAQQKEEKEELQKEENERKEAQKRKKDQDKAIGEVVKDTSGEKYASSAAKSAEGVKQNAAAQKETAQEKREEARRKREMNSIRKTINAILNQFSDDEGWLSSGKLGNQLSKRRPDFDVRNYGFSRLTSFIRSLGDYDVEKMTPPGGQTQVYLRLKKREGKN